MVQRKLRSRSLRKLQVVTPGSRTITQYKAKKPSPATCSKCGAILKGVPRKNTAELRNMPKTAKRPERPYGGVLCSRCMRELIREKARKSQ